MISNAQISQTVSLSPASIMWVIAIIYVACVLVSPSLAGIKELSSHFSDPKTDSKVVEGGTADIEVNPLEFHKENTVTNELIFDGFEDEDYIDFEKILALGSDDYM